MRKISQFIHKQALLAAAAACFLAAVSANAAQTAPYPLNGPWAMAVAPNGELYVANQHAGQVLIYNTNLVQQTSKTITAGLQQPTGLAFDSFGNLYVADIAQSVVNVYSRTGALIPTRTVTSNVYRPISIAVDGLNNLWVDSNFTQISIFDGSGRYRGKPVFDQTVINAVAFGGSQFAIGALSSAEYTFALDDLGSLYTGASAAYYYQTANSVSGIAFDANQNLYAVSGDSILYLLDTVHHLASQLATLDFVPRAVAVDSVHNHIFVSDFQNSVIYVYSLKGVLLTTLH